MNAEAALSSAPPLASTLPPGFADHPNHEITPELGRGGMVVVYLAQNRLMGRTEVLKVVGSHLVNRRGVGDRFLAEIRNAARSLRIIPTLSPSYWPSGSATASFLSASELNPA